MVNLRKMLRSFGFAMEGTKALFHYENNARFHLIAAIVVVLASAWFQISNIEWACVAFAIGGVCSAEAFNTSLEKLCDMVSPEIHPQIKAIKDLAAAGVLIMTLAAVVVGIAVFGPKIYVTVNSLNH